MVGTWAIGFVGRVGVFHGGRWVNGVRLWFVWA